MAGGTRTCGDQQIEKFSESAAARLPDGHGVRRGGGLEADGEEDDLFVGVLRGELRPRRAGE